MKVVLTQDVKGSGKKGDIVEVSDGYAKNFLLKKNLAVEANKTNVNNVTLKKEAEAFHRAEVKKAALELAEKLKKEEISVKVKSGETGKIFGSVTSKEIADRLIQLGYDIDKKKIILKEPIKKTGVYELDIKIMPEVNAKIKINIEKE